MSEIRITVPVASNVHKALKDAAKRNSRAVGREAAEILKRKFGPKPQAEKDKVPA